MLITPRPDRAEQVLTALSARSTATAVRSSGIHQSGIIQALLRQMDPKRYGTRDDLAPKELYFELGFAFERALELAFRDALFDAQQIIRPGEFECDGIHVTPDGLDIQEFRLHEFKLTWLSSREGVGTNKCWKWIVQIKGYAYVLKIDVATLWVLWVNSDYPSGPPTPKLEAFDLTFTDLELAENWSMLLAHKELAIGESHETNA